MEKACIVLLVVVSNGFACNGGNKTGSASSSSGGSGSSSSSSGGNATTDLTAHYKAFYASLCAFEQRCGNVSGREFHSEAACVAAHDAIVDTFLGSITNTYRITDSSAAQRCLDAINNRACDVRHPAECDWSYAELVDPALEGQSCKDKACDPILVCMPTHGTCQVCRSLTIVSEVGATCGSSGPYCAAGVGLYCASSHTCAVQKRKDEACDSAMACTFPLECVSGTCKSRHDVGDSCEQGRCMEDLECTGTAPNRTCTTVPVPGDPCGRTVEASCRFSKCVFTAANASAGTCTTSVPTTSDGDPCHYANGVPGCSEGLYPDEVRSGDTPQSCACRPLKPSDSACTMSSQCESRFCYGGSCFTRKANGEVCGIGYECLSWNCAGGVCSDPPPPEACP